MKDDHIVLDYAAPVKVQAFPQCFPRLLPFAGNRRADFFDIFFSNVFGIDLSTVQQISPVNIVILTSVPSEEHNNLCTILKSMT